MKFAFSFCLILVLGGTSVLMAQKIRPFHIQYDYRKPNSFFQNDTTLNSKRKNWITAIAAGGYGITALYMGTAWYSQEELTRFHFFDDSHEWKQIDKGGHMLGSYSASRWMIDLYKWAGVPKKRALVIGGVSGFLAMSSIEVFDGFGETWGFSWYDVGANFVGTSLAVGNQWLWNENRIQLKVSYRKSNYAGNPDFEDLFGRNFSERLLKDYNGHTIWMSVRVHSFLPEGKFKKIYPRWLNLAVGYGAEGLEGGYDDPTRAYLDREYRQLYLSFDIDLSNIRTRSGFLRSLFSVVSVIRIPMPAIRFDKTGVALRAFE